MPLYDGTTLPSYLEVDTAPSGGAEGSLGDTTLRIGEVVQALPPNDPNNRGASHNREWVYVVNVTYRDGVGMRSVVPYRCTVASAFGGLADHCRHTVRRTDTDSTRGFTNGSQVLVLCPNGDKSNALIIGGIRHNKDQSPDPNEIFFDFLFNGVHASIDAQGTLALVVPGPTKLDGSAGERDSNNHGSTVTFAKDGTIVVSDQNGDVISISPKDKTITTTAGSATTTIQQKWKLKVPTVEIEADNVTIKAQKINLGDAEAAINPLDEAVIGSGIDTFTGIPYKGLGNTSSIVKIKKQ